KNRLSKCIARCIVPPPLDENLVALACQYFLCEDQSHIRLVLLNYVVPKLEMALNGLNADQTIKVDTVLGGDPSALGHVRFEFDPAKFGSKENVTHQNLVAVQGVSRTAKAGAIHIRQDLLQGNGKMQLGVLTLIHEATHKYAGTVDFFS